MIRAYHVVDVRRDAAVDHARFPDKLCARRILCFLKRRHLHGAAHQLERETAVFFDMSHLRYLATTARWDELTSYVHRFLPSPTSLLATLFLHRLHIYQVLGTIADGGNRVNDIDRLYPLLDDTAAKDRPHVAALRIFFHDVRKRPPGDVASWMQVWKTAAEKLEKLALKCPELKGKLHLPHSPHYAPKRWQINLSGWVPCPYVLSHQLLTRRKATNPKRVISGVSMNKRSSQCMVICSSYFYLYLLKFTLFHCLLLAGDQQETFSSTFPLMSATELIGWYLVYFLFKKKNSTKGRDVPWLCIKKMPRSNPGFSSNETSSSMISDMQIELAVPRAPGADASSVAGILGGDGSLGKEEVDAGKSKKRKMSAMRRQIPASLACHLFN
ncbi:hypothetical protein EJB05_30108, partial [Eragrostis curvula]